MFFVRKALYGIHVLVYKLSLRGMGILNYENKKLSGEYAFLNKFFERKRTEELIVFDVGANVGDYSRILRECSKKAKIYAFEPHPVIFQKLKENARLYGFTAFCFGCGDKEGRFKFYDYKNSDGSSHANFCKDIIEKIHGSSAEESSAQMIKLDNFVLNELGIKKIDLLKIDTEGYEFMVLKGAERLIRYGLIDVIQFEFNEMNIISGVFFRDIYDFLSNYNFYRLLPDGLVALGKYNPTIYEIFAFQNIVAIRKGLKLSF